MKMWNVLLTLILISPAAHAASEDFSIKPFYQKQALVTQRLMPFLVTAPASEPNAEIISVTPSRHCMAMPDAHRSLVFMVYCLKPTTLQLQVLVKGKLSNFNLKAEALPIAEISIAPDVDDPGEVTGGPQPGIDPGKVIYDKRCVGCHNAMPAIPKGTTAQTVNRMKAAFLKDYNDPLLGPNVRMGVFHNKFTAKELEDLAKYINTKP